MGDKGLHRVSLDGDRLSDANGKPFPIIGNGQMYRVVRSEAIGKSSRFTNVKVRGSFIQGTYPHTSILMFPRSFNSRLLSQQERIDLLMKRRKQILGVLINNQMILEQQNILHSGFAEGFIKGAKLGEESSAK